MKSTIRFGVAHGMRGFFAIMYDDEGPINSVGSYSSSAEAGEEAAQWAESEGYPLQAEQLRTKYTT